MRIKGNGSPVEDLLIFLSRPEASELRDAIDALLENFDDAGWHAHVSSADYQTEITIAPDEGDRPVVPGALPAGGG